MSIEAPRSSEATGREADSDICIGDRVTVKSGVLEPGIESLRKDGAPLTSIRLDGWAGLVREITTDGEGREVVLLEWDSRTLVEAPQRWLAFCELCGATDPDEFGFMLLGIDEVERSAGGNASHQHDSAEKRMAARQAIAVQFEWAGQREALCDMVEVDNNLDDGCIHWSVAALRYEGNSVLIQREQQGLSALENANQRYRFEFMPGSYSRKGMCMGDPCATQVCLETLRAKNVPGFLVRATWSDQANGATGFEHDVVVALTPRVGGNPSCQKQL